MSCEFELLSVHTGIMSAFVGSALGANGGLGYLAIHAVQFGAQPILSKAYIEAGTPTTSLVLGAEVAKVVGCFCMLHNDGVLREVLRTWSLRDALLLAGIPSLTYLAQNLCIQVAYQNVDGVVFNILNQSKMPFTALFSYLIMGRRQSRIQCLALFAVTVAGFLIASNAPINGDGHRNGYSNQTLGVTCVLVASALSGLGSGLTEWILSGRKRNSYLFSAEMAIFGSITILWSLIFNVSSDAAVWREEGLFARWTWHTLIPVLTQGLGGIVVGLITKVAGGVKKGFAVICGLIFTCLMKFFVYGQPLTLPVCLAVPLVGASIFLHAQYPAAKKQV